MSNVCCVPLSYLFLRGQGVKIFSVIAQECQKDDEWFLCINRKYSYDAFMQYAFSQVSEKLIQNYVIVKNYTGPRISTPYFPFSSIKWKNQL